MKQAISERIAEIRGIIARIVFPFQFLYVCIYAMIIRIRDLHGVFVPQRPKSLRGEIILVTGGSSGIGRAICNEIALNETNATIIVWDSNEKANLATVEELQSLGVRNAYAYTVDVSDREQVSAAANKIRAEIGDVSVLFNNAGILGNRKQGWTDDLAVVEKVFAVNFLSHCWTLREFLPKMIENGRGHVIETCSLMGVVRAPSVSAYVSSKHALLGYIESVKEDVRHLSGNLEIDFTVVYPPVTTNSMTAYLNNTTGSSSFLLGQPLTPEYTASKIVEGVVNRKEYIYVKGFVRYMGFLNEIFPPEATRKFYDFMGVLPMLESSTTNEVL